MDLIMEGGAAATGSRSGREAAHQAPLFLRCGLSVLSVLTAIVSVSDAVHCGSAVVRVQGTRGQSLWQSPKVDVDDFSDRFIGALFTPGKGQERENGHLDKCLYRMGNGQIMALRYDTPGKLDTMSLTATLHWQLTTDPLNQDVCICQDSQPDNCSFTVRRLH
ncbi:DUF3757 domain-containing protein [Pseudomonas sp. M5A4_2d]